MGYDVYVCKRNKKFGHFKDDRNNVTLALMGAAGVHDYLEEYLPILPEPDKHDVYMTHNEFVDDNGDIACECIEVDSWDTVDMILRADRKSLTGIYYPCVLTVPKEIWDKALSPESISEWAADEEDSSYIDVKFVCYELEQLKEAMKSVDFENEYVYINYHS